MKELSVEKMEEVNGGRWLGCAAAIAGTGLFLAGLFAVPVGGAALAIYVANAVIGPSAAGISLVTSCFDK